MSVRWYTYSDSLAAAEACAHHITGLLDEVLSGQEFATFAVSGGSTPKPLFDELAKIRFEWNRVHLFWVDERCVPPSDPDSNYKLINDSFIKPVRLPQRQVHRICGELLPDTAAKRYASDIQEFFGLESGELPHFDVMHRGMGSDAHTASLFPGDHLIDDRDHIAAATHSNAHQHWRVTLLPGVLLEAKHTVFLVTGGDKKEAVRAVFHEPYDPKRYPAQMASHHMRRVAWFLDKEAAALMD